MNLKKIIIISLLFVMTVGIAPVSAESGNIVIEELAVKNYDLSNYGVSSINWSKIHFDVSNYNYLSSFHVHPYTATTFALPFESTSFSFVSGASGSGGWASYDRNTSTIYYVFDSNTLVTSSPIVLAYSNPTMFTNITLTTGHTWQQPVSANRPVIFYDPVEEGVSMQYHSVTVSVRGIDYYTVTYPISGHFKVDVIKNPYVDSKYFINSATSAYSQETTFNKVNIVGALFPQIDGIYLNATLASGVYTNKLINSSGISDYIPPDEPIVVDPVTGVGINVSPTTGYQGTVFNISWLRTTPTPFGYIDSIEIYESGITAPVHIFTSPPDAGYIKATFTVASYTVQFRRNFPFTTPKTLASASFVVKPEQPSYLIVNATVLTKTNIPIVYFIGTNLTGYITGNKSLMMLEIREYDGIDFINPRYYNILNQSGTINHIFPLPKKYKVSLFDYLKGAQLYEKIVTAIYSPDDIILEKIKTSYITSDKTIYYYGEMITGTYGIDDTNYSQYNIIVSLLNETNGNIYCSYNAGENFDLKTGTFLYDFIHQSGNYYMGCEKAAGAANITMYRNNNSILERITSVSFNISNTNPAGYGLKVISTGCQKFSIAAISPAVAKLELVDYNGKVEKYFNFSGTLNIIYSTKTKSQYTFNLYDSAGTLQISKIMPGSSECIAVIVDDDKTYGGNVTATCGFWDNCVNGMFPGQGLNNVTRLLFSLFCIVVTMFFGMIVSKGNFGVSIILGFLPYAFFTYMTISSPCGEYMPLWVTIFIALIIGIKMRWFN